MRIFLSGFESQDMDRWLEIDPELELTWVLMSYAYIRGCNPKKVQRIIDMAELVMVDSGAHSFQKKSDGMDWEEYTREYGEWIREHDCDKIVGYFEMDIDNVVGYERVLELRDIMFEYTDKVIPVWHKSRGNDDFEKMCRECRSGIVSMSGVADRTTDDELKWMVRTAWENGCKIHGLGITVKRVLNAVPFDYVDSSSWVQEVRYGRSADKAIRRLKGVEGTLARMASHEHWQRLQRHYFDKWKGVSPLGD